MKPPKKQIEHLLSTHFEITGTWNLNSQGLVDVNGNIHVHEQPKDRLCVAFGHVSGSFRCEAINLPTLEGAPHSVGSNFVCLQTNLRTLMGAPQTVGGNFMVGNNQLTSLQGGPQEVGADYGVYLNHLLSLEGAPQSVGRRFLISYYPDIPLLKLFNYNHVVFVADMKYPVPEIWNDLFDREKHPDLQGGGRVAIMKAVAILTKAGLYKNNPNAQQ